MNPELLVLAATVAGSAATLLIQLGRLLQRLESLESRMGQVEGLLRGACDEP
ncbi:MAG: hypothetical protein ACYCWW_00110 [Deltaproteobacteria bacterium]